VRGWGAAVSADRRLRPDTVRADDRDDSLDGPAVPDGLTVPSVEVPADPTEPRVSANATAGRATTAAPTPRATANAPTRPIDQPGPAVAERPRSRVSTAF
jgi:hypothetical protein